MSAITNVLNKYNKALNQSAERRAKWHDLAQHTYHVLSRIISNNTLLAEVIIDSSIKELPKVIFTINPPNSLSSDKGEFIDKSKAVLSFTPTYNGMVKIEMMRPAIVNDYVLIPEDLGTIPIYNFGDKEIDDAFVKFIDKLCEYEGYKDPTRPQNLSGFFH